MTCHASFESVLVNRKWLFFNNEEMRLKKIGVLLVIIDKKVDLGLLLPFSLVYNVHVLLQIESLI